MSVQPHKIHQSQILSEIILDFKIEKIAEIGVWKGHTVKRILRKRKLLNLKEYWAIDPWLRMGPKHGRMHRKPQEGWDEIYFYVCSLMYYFPQLRVLRMTSIEAARIFPKDYFDMIFLDSIHSFDVTEVDIKAWLPLTRQGGILSGHDFGTKALGVGRAVRQAFGKNFKVYPSSVWMHQVDEGDKKNKEGKKDKEGKR